MTERTDNKKFMAGLLLFGAVLFFYYYDGVVKPINATMMAFSYRDGFVSRGLVGSIYQWLDKALPVDMMNYEAVKVFAMAGTLLFFVLLYAFYGNCLKKSGRGVCAGMCGVMIMLTIFTVPTFTCQYNFGRFDMYLCLLTVAAVLLLMERQCEWTVIPIAALCVMIHQGYVFMYLNVLLVILFYRWMSAKEGERKKYAGLFLAAFAVASVLFLYFEFFSHRNGGAAYDEVVAAAKLLCSKGKYHRDVIDAEILGVNLAKREWKYHLMNFVQLPVFLILTAPYIMLGARFFGGMVRRTGDGKSKLKYLAVAAGGLTLLPNFILKIDYGRWMYALVFYYTVITLWLLAERDEIAAVQMEAVTARIKGKPAGMLLLAYPMLLTPFWDVAINRICSVFAGIPNDLWWHLW